jgi:hypothetical protein
MRSQNRSSQNYKTHETKAAPAAGWAPVKDIVAALMQAVQRVNVEEVNNLAAKLTPKQINKTNENGNNALMIAAARGHVALVEILLDKGAKIDAINKEGRNALMFAAKSGNVEVVKMLLDKGANINAVTNKDSTTALMIAAKSGNDEMVGILLNKGAKIDAINKEGQNALMIAAEKGHRGVVIILAGRLSAEQIRQVNIYGKNALDIAKEKSSSCKGYTEVFEILAGILTEKSRAAAIDQVPEKSHSQNPDAPLASKSEVAIVGEPEEIEDQPGMNQAGIERQAVSAITDAIEKAGKAAESLEGIHLSPEEKKSLSDARVKIQKLERRLEALQTGAERQGLQGFAERIAASRNAPAAAAAVNPVMEGPGLEEDNGPPGAAAGQGLQGFANPDAPHAAADPGRNQQPVGQHTQRAADRAVDGKGRAAANRR